ncbi:histidine kinase [Streptomyces hygroscopicus subsp. jinggangensis 5008]|uniref:Regulatory protein n=1 Tax=Streptomyces hygroscopicus subsp. jinggangensis TaxID=311982 RepID=Q1L2J7_STRHY|nr:regulatory protein [Streptomyces hygroscopicus subsp. jinggangensis]AEY85567.1 histidine kinase [Streptomyces hygroscopicus subsp. jinggangensis 5008]AGF59789.1 histidine kinase [Streptomyces hygroscopicus subsp. jinggangensis TL01]
MPTERQRFDHPGPPERSAPSSGKARWCGGRGRDQLPRIAGTRCLGAGARKGGGTAVTRDSGDRDAHSLNQPPRVGGDDLDRLQQSLRQLAHAHGRMRSLLDAVLSISSALDLTVVLHTIAESARGLVDARYAAIGVLGEEGEFTELITSGFGADRFRGEDGPPLPHGTGLLGELVRHPEPLRVDDLATHPQAAGFPEDPPS